MSKRFLLDTYIVDTANKYNVTVDNITDSLDTLLNIIAFGEWSDGFIILLEKGEDIIKALGLIAHIYNIRGEKAAYVLSYFYSLIPNYDISFVKCIEERVYEKEMYKAISAVNNKMYEV